MSLGPGQHGSLADVVRTRPEAARVLCEEPQIVEGVQCLDSEPCEVKDVLKLRMIGNAVPNLLQHGPSGDALVTGGEQGILWLVVIVGGVRTVSPRAPERGDATAFAIFGSLGVALSQLAIWSRGA